MPKTMLLVVDGSPNRPGTSTPCPGPPTTTWPRNRQPSHHSASRVAEHDYDVSGARRRRLNPDIDTGTMFASYFQFQLHPNMPPSQTSPKICDVLITLNSPPSTPSPQSPLLLPPPKHSRLVVASVYTDNDYLVVFVVPEAKGKALELSMMLDWLGQG
uniref:Uncharacterized protein n=1 Tax=Moniliophthora roreri TaxID=221103 RepID=A0A0W0FN28_MONRR